MKWFVARHHSYKLHVVLTESHCINRVAVYGKLYGGLDNFLANSTIVGVQRDAQHLRSGKRDVEYLATANGLGGGAVQGDSVRTVAITQDGRSSCIVYCESAVNRAISSDGDAGDVNVGLGKVKCEHTAEVLEGELVVAALGIHGELVDRALNVGLCSGKGNVHAIGGQRGGVEGAEGTVARLSAHIVKYGNCGRGLRGGTVDACTCGAVDGNLVASHPVEVKAVEGCLAVLRGAVLYRGTELRAVAQGVLLLAGGQAYKSD